MGRNQRVWPEAFVRFIGPPRDVTWYGHAAEHSKQCEVCVTRRKTGRWIQEPLLVRVARGGRARRTVARCPACWTTDPAAQWPVPAPERQPYFPASTKKWRAVVHKARQAKESR